MVNIVAALKDCRRKIKAETGFACGLRESVYLTRGQLDDLCELGRHAGAALFALPVEIVPDGDPRAGTIRVEVAPVG